MANQTPAKVFISYSHDSSHHSDRVLALADRFCEEGVDCHIDQYETSPPEGWPRWMTRRVDWADFVLVVCTETYRRRLDGHEPAGTGRGVKWEGAIISQVIYEHESNNSKFVPVVFSPGDRAHVPVFLGGATLYRLEDDYERLYRHLTGQHLTPKPVPGKIRSLPPKSRTTVEHHDRPVAVQENPFDPWMPATSPRFHGRILAERIFQRTGGQPMLLQLHGQTLINRLNDQQRQQATDEDLRSVDEDIRTDGYAIYYFRNIHRSAPPTAREAMEALALGETVTLERTARRWLRRRCLINDDDTPAIPVMFHWLREELEG